MEDATLLREALLDEQGLQGLKRTAFHRILEKVEAYIDISLQARTDLQGQFRGLPPTILEVHWEPSTAAIDQQRQLYAAAQAVLADPQYGQKIVNGNKVIEHLIQWHDAFVQNFVDTDNRVRASVKFSPDGSSPEPQKPDPRANLRLTYAIEGSAMLTRALLDTAELTDELGLRNRYREKAEEIKNLALLIGEQFHADFSDPQVPGRYFLFPNGKSDVPGLEGLSHNNSQSYLIEGMSALAALDSGKWRPRLESLIQFIQSRRDPASGLLREFDFPQGNYQPNAVKLLSEFSWQNSSNDRERVILGHTIAGLYTVSAKLLADSDDPMRSEKAKELTDDFIGVMNRIGGIHANGLLANAYELDSGDPPAREEPWPEGAWQTELLWQFLLHVERAGVDLSQFEVEAGTQKAALDRILARGLEFHDRHLFNGTSYLAENNPSVRIRIAGRQYAAPINHAAETLRDLARNLQHGYKTSITSPLGRLVYDLVNAENYQDSKAADPIISPNFISITRSNGVEEDRLAILHTIAKSPNPNIIRHLVPNTICERIYGDLGVVRSLVTTEDRSAPDVVTGTFRNIHVFEKHGRDWKCIIWQVTKLA